FQLSAFVFLISLNAELPRPLRGHPFTEGELAHAGAWAVEGGRRQRCHCQPRGTDIFEHRLRGAKKSRKLFGK
ncbi:MAG: hypothetical protein LBK60_10765, partial [Verrucomicrobiales bacterium]|nr:hypothetical protein [Verrucomicrobiales bacterium]